MKYLVTAAALVVVALSNVEAEDIVKLGPVKPGPASPGEKGKELESRMGYYGINKLEYPGSYGSMEYPNGRYCYGGASLSGDLGLCDYPSYPYSGNPYYGNPVYGNQYGNPLYSNQYGNSLYGNPALGNPLYGNNLYGNPALGNPLVGNPLVGRSAVLG